MSENAQRPAPTAPLPVKPLTPFEKKVRWGTRALYLERLWPRLWLIVGVVGLFVLASLAGFWIEAGQLAHKLALAAFAVALVGAFVYAARVQWPSREDAIRRIEQRSGFPHRPATSYEDTLTLNHDDPSTQAIWQAHKTRLADLVGRLRVGRPAPRTDRLDPFAVRGLMLLGMMMLLGIVGDSARDRVMAAFRFGPPLTAADARLDAWVTPPAYTSKPPILLADGQRGGLLMAGADGKPLEVPENSVIIARTSGIGAARLEIEMKPDNNGPVVRQAAVPPDPIPGAAPKTGGCAGRG